MNRVFLMIGLLVTVFAATSATAASVDCTRPFEPLPAECVYNPNLNRSDYTEDHTDSHANDVDSDAPSAVSEPSESDEGDEGGDVAL